MGGGWGGGGALHYTSFHLSGKQVQKVASGYACRMVPLHCPTSVSFSFSTFLCLAAAGRGLIKKYSHYLWGTPVQLFCTDSANIFYQPPPACCKTEKGGEGERDTGRTVKGVPSGAHSLRQPAVPAHQTGGRRCRGEPPTPQKHYFDSLRLQRWFSSTASNL